MRTLTKRARPLRTTLLVALASLTAAGCFGGYTFVGIGTAVDPVPARGITPEVAATQNFQLQGLWPEEPHRAIAFGTIYFAGLAVVCAALEWHAFRHESWLTAKSNRRR